MRCNGMRVRGALGAAFLVGALGACQDFISPIDSNPNSVPDATVDQLFTGIQVNTWFLAEGHLSRLTSMWLQQMTGTDRQFTALDVYQFTEQEVDGEFQALYVGGGLVDLQQAIEKAEDAGRRSYAGILKIHQAYLFGMGASIWGALPYSEAANPEIETPALDDQAAIYTAVQSLLDEAIGDLGAGGTGPGVVDIALGGNVGAWTAVARTLKARFHMHWAEVDPGRYAQALTQAESGIKSAAHDWLAIHSSTATENNAWYQFSRDRSGYISSGDYLLPLMRDGADPRIAKYFTTVGGSYISPGEAGAGDKSQLSETGIGAPAAPFPLVTCAENYFIMAEAFHHAGQTANAIAAAKDALACQEEFHGVSLAAEKAAFDGLSGAALKARIMQQKYVALFLNVESWNDYKRTCLPAITPRVAEGMPARLFYGEAERQTNPNIPTAAEQARFGTHGFRAGANANDPNGCS